MKHFILKTLIFFIVALYGAVSYAQMAHNLLIGNAKAITLGNAVTADPPGIDSIHFNPAGLTRLKGHQYELKFIMGDVTIGGAFELNNQDIIAKYEEKGFEDPVANTKTTVDAFAVYLPFVGHTDIPILAAPLGGVSWNREGSKFTFANAVYAPMIFGMSRKDDDPGRFYGRELSITRLTFFSPSVGYQWTDTLSVGLSVGFSYVGVGVDLPYRAPSQLLEELTELTNDLCGRSENPRYFLEISDSILDLDVCRGQLSPFETLFDLEVELEKVVSITYNLGILWEATDWLTLGFAYLSGVADVLKGPLSIQIEKENLLQLVQGLTESTIFGSTLILETFIRDTIHTPVDGLIETTGQVTLNTPQHVTAGISVKVLPRLKVNIDVKWTETSVWKDLTFRFDEKIGLFDLFSIVGVDGAYADRLEVPRGYVDTVNWGIGFEYQYNQKLDLRLGFEPRKTGIPDNRRDYLIPLSDIDVIAVGFSYKLTNHSSFDFAFSHIKSEMFIPTGTSTNGNDIRFNNFVFNPTAGLDTYSSIEITIIETSYRTTF